MTDNDKSVSEKIKYYRKLAKMSQEELATASGINVSTIKKYECGFRNPKPNQLAKIASALGISNNALLSYEVASVSDIISLLIKLDQQTQMQIAGDQDASGNFIPDSISLTFADQDINNALALYLKYKEERNTQQDSSDNSDTSQTVTTTSYQYQLGDLLLDIDRQIKK